MRNTKRRRCWLALALCLCLLAGVFPLSGMTYAAETGCNHIHDDTCGFVKAVAGAPCTHVHDAGCGGLAQGSGPVPCTKTEGCKLPAGHEGDCDAPMLLAENSDYDPGDVAVINGFIENNGLTWTKDDPGSWEIPAPGGIQYLEWDDSTPKRIKELHISSADLTGTLNVTDLTSLETLICYDNSLTGLDVSNLSNLQNLNCVNNSLNSLDLTGLAKLQYLYCSNNPFQSLKLPGGETLTVNVSPANSGNVMFSHTGDFLSYKTVTLTATPETGYTFTGWTGDASGSDAKNSFTLSGNMTVTANFTADPAAILEVTFNNNGSGGKSLDDNDMKTAVETALGVGDKTKFTTIRLTGSATEITGYNWKYLLSLYGENNEWTWTNLAVIDLSGMGGLTKVENEPAGITIISSLTEVQLPTGLEIIGDSAFYSCTALKSVDLSACTSLKTIEHDAYYNCKNLESVDFPASLEIIGDSAFYSCTALQSVSLPASLETISEAAFTHCAALTAFSVATDNQHFASQDGVLYDKNKITLLQYPIAKSGTDFAIPGTVTTIGALAFYSCTSLQSVSFPTGLQTIGEEAFYSCTSLQSASFPTGLQTIGRDAFQDCTSLQSVSFPTGLQTIGKDAFQGCTSLQSVSFPTGLQTIGKGAFKGCTSLVSMTFRGETPPSLDAFAFGNTTGSAVVPANGTLYSPAKAAAAYASGTFGSPVLDSWMREALYTLTVNGGSDETGVGFYPEGEQAKITANAAPNGKTFDGWTTSGGGSFADKNSTSTTFTMPAADVTVTANYKDSGGSDPTPSTYSLTVQAETGGKITQGVSGNYAQGASITLKAEANANYAFDGWTTSGGGSFADQNSAATTFTMPGNATIVTANFRYTGGGSDPDPGPSYTWRALTDPSGVRVSGLFTSGAALEVKEMLLHLQGDCDVCDNIRERQENGELIVLYDIALKSGSYTGDLTVEIPVGEGYNGQTVIILHCKDKVLDSRTLTVENGMAKGTFTSLSPFAVAKVPASTVITGLPESYTLPVGRSVSWTPSPAGGAWSYDTDLLEMARQGDTYTFKALKEGKAAATYTVDGVPFTVTIAVNASTIPHTGDTTSTLPWALLMLAALGGAGGLLAWRRFGCKKRRG